MIFHQAAKAARLLCLFRLLSIFPLPVAYRLAGLVGRLDAAFGNAYLSAIASGMSRVRTDCFALPPYRIAGHVSMHSMMMAREVIDAYITGRRGGHLPGEISSLSGHEIIRDSLDAGQGVIVLVSHYSRLNMVACSLGHAGIPTGIITQCVDRRNRLLDWVDRAYLSGKLERYHRVTRGPLVTLEDNLRPIYRALLEGQAVIMLMDAFHPRFRRFVSYPFLGGSISLPAGALRLAGKTGASMVYGVARESGWHVDVEIRPLPGEPGDAMSAAVEELERDVMERPWEWWQWFNIREIWQKQV